MTFPAEGALGLVGGMRILSVLGTAASVDALAARFITFPEPCCFRLAPTSKDNNIWKPSSMPSSRWWQVRASVGGMASRRRRCALRLSRKLRPLQSKHHRRSRDPEPRDPPAGQGPGHQDPRRGGARRQARPPRGRTSPGATQPAARKAGRPPRASGEPRSQHGVARKADRCPGARG